MIETVRDYVKRRLRWFYAICGVGFALVLVPGAINDYGWPSKLLRLAGILLLVGGTLVMARLKCPKCSKPLGKFFLWQRGTLDFCPNCGVRLDDPY
jgi:hypothetical protein